MSPRFVLGRENVPCIAEVVNRSLKADCTDLKFSLRKEIIKNSNSLVIILLSKVVENEFLQTL